MTDNVSDSILIYRICFTIFWTFAFLFCMCEFGYMVTNQFDMFDDAIGYCKWYLLPIDMKRMIVILMANHQRPITIHGSGNILCTRIAFKKVSTKWLESSQNPLTKMIILICFQTIHGGYSYFMTLYRLNK